MHQKIKVDLAETNPVQKCEMGRQDTNRVLDIHLFVQGVPFHLADADRFQFNAIKSDGKGIMQEDGITGKGNIVSVKISQNTLAVAGDVKCQLEIYDSDGKYITTAAFIINVFNMLFSEDFIESTDEYKALVAYVEEARKYRDEAEQFHVSAKESSESAQTAHAGAAASEKAAALHKDAAKKSEENAASSEKAASSSAVISYDNAAACTKSAENASKSASLAKESADRSEEIKDEVEVLIGGIEGSKIISVNHKTPDGLGNVELSKSDIGLGNVPNVATNSQTPTWTMSSILQTLTSGEPLATSFSKLARVVADYIGHKVQAATASILGHVKITTGNGLANASGQVSMARASTSVVGATQLNNTLASTSTTTALTAAQGKVLNDKIAEHKQFETVWSGSASAGDTITATKNLKLYSPADIIIHFHDYACNAFTSLEYGRIGFGVVFHYASSLMTTSGGYLENVSGNTWKVVIVESFPHKASASHLAYEARTIKKIEVRKGG